MKITTSLVALLATAAAAPTSAPAEIFKRFDLCAHSTFVGETTETSALVADCEHLLAYLGNPRFEAVKWEIFPSQTNLASYGSCMISARSLGEENAFLGSGDAYDLLRDGVRDKQENGRIGVRGVLPCGEQQVEWWVWHWV